MLPALSAGFILLFIVGVREFTIPLVLYSPDNVVCRCCCGSCSNPASRRHPPRLHRSSSRSLPVIFVARRTLARRSLAD
jgi:hypothetical protein